jgi:hypothetical protein
LACTDLSAITTAVSQTILRYLLTLIKAATGFRPNEYVDTLKLDEQPESLAKAFGLAKMFSDCPHSPSGKGKSNKFATDVQ